MLGCALTSVVGCGGSSGGKKPKPGDEAGVGDDEDMSGNDAGASKDASNSTDPDAGGTGGTGGGPDGGGGTTGGGMSDAMVTGPDGSVITGDAQVDGGGSLPVRTTLRQVGRFGGDVRIDVDGMAFGSSATALRLQLFASDGTPVPLADLDGDGKPDVGTVEYPLSSPITTAGGKAFVLLTGAMASHPEIARVDVTWVDNKGVGSNTGSANLVAQPVKNTNELCDVMYLDDRCDEGLGCKGTLPTVCKQGEAPSIGTAGYFSDELGARVLVVAQDPDDDVLSYVLRFLDAGGSPVNVIDNDGNGIPEASSLENQIAAIGQGGSVFFSISISENAASLAAKVELTVTDRGGRMSPAKVLTKAAAPLRNRGQSCDTRQFDRCAASNVCSATGTSTAGTCVATDTARTAACKAALVLTPVDGMASVRGTIGTPSLWDVPTGGCSVNDPVNRPEALVKFTLAQKATRVTLSTNHAYTSFDTTLYVLSSCSAAPTVAWCDDDRPTGITPEPHTERAALTLMNLPAGEYFVVVDSFPSQLTGTGFQLSLLIE
ncbi:MAG: hypothetical protein RJA49_1642 [Actinomycetota bacterium]